MLPDQEDEMARKRTGYVTVDGVTYGPGDEMPGDAEKKIDNPSVFAADNVDDDAEPGERMAAGLGTGDRGNSGAPSVQAAQDSVGGHDADADSSSRRGGGRSRSGGVGA
jgi:hypothetical protein